jgi:transmembrane sensor
MHHVNPHDIARYLAGTCTPEDEQRVRAWLDAHPQVRARLLEGDASVVTGADTSEALERLRSRTRRGEAAAAPRAVHFGDRRQPARIYRWGVAAAAIAAVVLFFMLMVPSTDSGNDVPGILFSTGAGERQEITLADGSTLVLGPESRAVVAGDFGSVSREIRLEGFGYFEVATGDVPFVVLTNRFRTEVLGTRFIVEDFADEIAGGVVVDEGRVAVRAVQSAARGATVVTAGRQARLGGDGVALETDDADLEAAFSWREGRLVFRGATLAEVARDLRRWRGIEVRLVDPSLASLRVDATFRDESPRDIAIILSTALNLSWRLTEGRVEFSRP